MRRAWHAWPPSRPYLPLCIFARPYALVEELARLKARERLGELTITPDERLERRVAELTAECKKLRELLCFMAMPIVEWSAGIYCYECRGCDECEQEWKTREQIIHGPGCQIAAALASEKKL